MKKVLFFAIVLLISSCTSLNNQVNQVKALENCKYLVNSVDSITVAAVDVTDIISKEKLDLTKMPRLAIAMLRKNVPLKARLNLSIHNPSGKLAAINQFEYKILIKNQELANGLVNQRIAISPNGGTTLVPIHINSNIYAVLSDKEAMKAITDFMIEGGADGGDKKEKKGVVTIKIKPTLDWGNKLIKYPGYITIEKEINSKNLF